MATLYVLAGADGAGKSSIGGAMIRAAGADYYNPDEFARTLRTHDPGLSRQRANEAAWSNGVDLLERAIDERLNFALESTLGVNTIPALLVRASNLGVDARVWYVGLANVELHIARVRARVAGGGHEIPESDIRRRFQRSRINLIELMPALTSLRVYDNSVDADSSSGSVPLPVLVLHLERRRIVGPADLRHTPEWAKPIVAAALQLKG